MSVAAFRFAPSPNGELHLGHAYSALLNARMAAECGGRFLIRIEDIDTVRCTAQLTALALADLAWLGLTWEQPVRVQSRHMNDYAGAQRRLAELGLLYPCFCSRKDVAAPGADPPRDPEGQPLYSGACRRLAPSEIGDRMAGGIPHAMRLDMRLAQSRLASPLTFEEKAQTVAADPSLWGDVVLARKDIGTSYHLAVVTDDCLQGVSHVVRGRDLHAATAIHRLLQDLLGLPAPHYHHHELIGDETGRKLSKSAGDISLRALREQGVSAAAIRRALGFP
ncbi:MAG: tRNA glutamyl-Q(34) synthetase GluQRS [Hyphomicrobiales bacterium]